MAQERGGQVVSAVCPQAQERVVRSSPSYLSYRTCLSSFIEACKLVPVRPSILLLVLPLSFACSHSFSSDAAGESRSPLVAEANAERAGATAPGAQVVQRKRIRKGTLHLTVERPARSRLEVERIVASSQGFLEGVESTGADNATASSVRIVARIPESQFDAVIARLRKLGRVGQESQESKDVTREIVDTDARLRNLQRTEERLLALLTQQSAVLADVLAVERELTRVRGEIEQLTSALKALEHDVAMATLTVHLSNDEPADLEGPDDAWKPARKLWREGGAVVARSAAGLVWFAAGVVRLLLMLLPWTPVLGVAWLVWRRARRK